MFQATTAQVEGAEKETLVDDLNAEIGEGEEEDNFEHLKEDGGNDQEGGTASSKATRSRNSLVEKQQSSEEKQTSDKKENDDEETKTIEE